MKSIKTFLYISIIINILLGGLTAYFYIHPKVITKTQFQTVTKTVLPDYKVTEALLTLINKYRANQNLPSIERDFAWCDQAQIRLNEIVVNYTHDGMRNILSRKNYHKLGENLAEGYTSDENVLSAWIDSPTHKEVLDDPTFKWGCVKTNGNETVLLASDTF